MVEVTESATTQITEYFKDKDVSPIRIFLNAGGWGGPAPAMALDEPKETDNVYEIDGYTYIVDKEFLEKVKPIKVDFSVMGFKIDCGFDFGSGSECSGCGTSETKSSCS